MRWIEYAWYQKKHSLLLILRPLSWIYYLVVVARQLWFKLVPPSPLAVPVIVIGNLTVGGTGKTPLTIHLANELRSQGHRVGIVSRGYQSKPPYTPYLVNSNDAVSLVGDEAKLIAQKTQCPVVIDSNRRRGAQYLISQAQSDLILSDDGLQHLRLPRSIEIVVVDGERHFGNGQLLPSGPLRESLTRLNTVDFIIVNGGEIPSNITNKAYGMNMQIENFRHYRDAIYKQADYFSHQKVAVVTAIGNPNRLVTLLKNFVESVHLKALPDHHSFRLEDFESVPDIPIIVTEKDAVKCEFLYQIGTNILNRLWVLESSLKLDVEFITKLNQSVGQLKYG